MSLKNIVKQCVVACAVGTATCGASAQASRWPDKPVRIIVPFAPGGTTDLVARMIGADIAKDLGQPVIVENRPGAAGNLGAEQVAKSTADGYTLLWGTIGTQAINQLVSKKLPYDSQKDFKPISMVASFPNLLVVPVSSPARNVGDLVALGKTKALNYASTGVGSSLHLSGELFSESAGITMVHVPYKGSSQAMTDVVGSQVDLVFDNLPAAFAMAKGGKVRPLAVTGAKRFPLLPHLPTMSELGYTNFVVEAWNGLLAPAGTPDAVIQKLDAVIKNVVSTPEFSEKLIQAGAERNYKNPAAFSQHIQTEYEKCGKFIQAHQISVD